MVTIPKPSDIMLTTLVTPSAPKHESFNENNTRKKNEVQIHVSSVENNQIVDGFITSYNEAIKLSKNSMIQVFFPIPSGREHGIFLAIDLGGSTLRVAIGEILNNKFTTINENSWLINDNQKLMDESFFQMIAKRVKTVIDSQSVLSGDEIIHSGITWSFPLKQTRPNNGFIENVSKGYELTSYSRQKDLKQLLEKACNKIGIKLSIDAIINDAISIFVAGKYLHNSEMGLVLGTGTNCSISILQSLLSEGKRLKNSASHCLLNTELSFFGYHLQSLCDKYDKMIDKRWELDFTKVPLPHMNTELYGVFQPLELMTGGRYITELIRLRILESIKKGSLSISSESLPTAFELDSESVCNINETSDFELFEKIYKLKTNEKDRQIISTIITTVIDRAIHVLGLSIIALMKVLEETGSVEKKDSYGEVKIGYVGSIMKYFHKYRQSLEDFINSEQKKRRVRFVSIENSSVIGAAVSAAVNNSQ